MSITSIARDLWLLISSKRKLLIILLFLVMLLSGISETTILISAIPYLTAISKPDAVWENPIIKKFSSFVDLNSNSELIIYLSIIFALIVIVAYSIQLFNLWLNRRIAAIIGSELSTKVLKKILSQSYEVHIKENSSSVIASISKYIDDTVSMIRMLLEISTQIIISLFLVITLIYIDGLIAISAGLIFGWSYYFLSFKTKNKLLKNSQSIANAKTLQIKTLQESLGGIREVIINGSQNFHLENFKVVDYPMRYKQAQNSFIAAAPRYIIEAVGYIMICILCLAITKKGTPQNELITTLGILALASQRLLPSLQKVYAIWAQMKGITVEVVKIIEIMNKKVKIARFKAHKEIIKFDKEIIFKNINFRYEKNNTYILKNINLKINSGEKIGIIGETGSGKSTFLDIICGLLIPTSGDIIIDGKKEIFKTKNSENLIPWRKLISYVPQYIFLTDSSFAENIALAEKKNEINIEKMIIASKQAKIHNFINGTNKGYFTNIGERGIKISGGQRQRIGIARALYKNCKLLILDEATSALDQKTELDVMNAINNLNSNLTLIIVSHRLDSLKSCDRVFELKEKNLKEVNLSDL